MTEWTIPDVLDTIADAVPDRLMTAFGERRSTFAQSAERSTRFGNFLTDLGFGVHTPREQLDRWQTGQDRVAMVMLNDLYLDVLVGTMKARTVPVNVNHHYTAQEIRSLLDYVQPSVIVYHRRFGEKVAPAAALDCVKQLVVIEDGSDVPVLPGSIDFDDAVAGASAQRTVQTSPDDLLMMCTGGTTGRPKGVLWRQGDLYVSGLTGADHESPQPLYDMAAGGGQIWFAVSPLLHAAGLWTALSGVLTGQSVILHDDRHGFDADRVLSVAEQERVALMTIVGDAYAGPIAAQLRQRRYDLDSLYAIGTGGAATNPEFKAAILEALPQCIMIDGYGSSETGGMGFGTSTHGSKQAATFDRRDGAAVVSADKTRFLEPGDDEIGWTARTGRVPLGYHDHAEATVESFPVIDGVRTAIPGDRASLAPDGTINLLGRDALVVNTGGEKVFVEEVEEVLRIHPMLADALVVGRPSERWGNEVVALIVPRADTDPESADLKAFAAEHLARYKVPKAFIRVDAIRRLGNGKPDYRWAKVTSSSPATAGPPTGNR